MILKDRIITTLPHHAACFTQCNGAVLYVRDMKPVNGGTATIDVIGGSMAVVDLLNPLQLTVDFDAFPDNGLPISVGYYEKQCECVLFPEGTDQDEWVLFVETKYVKNLKNAQNKKYGYPQQMVTQIKKTVKFFRDKQILSQDKRVYAIVSYPTLEEGFESWFFPVKYEDGTIESVEDILLKYKIHIRATNSATIKSVKCLKLGAIGQI